MPSVHTLRAAQPARYPPSQTALVVLAVLLLHALGVWALQSGLLQRVVEVVVAVQAISTLQDLPIPKAVEPPPPPPPVPKAVPLAKPTETPAVPTPVAAPVPSTPLASTSVEASPAFTAPVAPAPPAPVVVAAAPSPPPATAPAPKLELPSSDADYLHNPRPGYPRLSRQRGEQGKVVVQVFIGIDGTAQRAEIKVSSGFERLDQAALATARAWRYVPGKRGGVPEAMWFSVPINFVLE